MATEFPSFWKYNGNLQPDLQKDGVFFLAPMYLSQGHDTTVLLLKSNLFFLKKILSGLLSSK